MISFASWATLQDHQNLHHHLYWGASACYFFVFRLRCMFNDLFMFQALCSHTRSSSRPYWRFLPHALGHEFSDVYVLNNWYYLCKTLVTPTTIATPRYSEGIGISGFVGRSLEPLSIVFFYAYDSDLFHAIHVLRLPMKRFCSARGV